MTHPSPAGAGGPWTAWTTKAVLAAGGMLCLGMMLLGLPGAVFLEVAGALGIARKLAPDSVWPLAILITMVGSMLIAPASLALRYRWPHITGWDHVWRTALVTFVATFLFTVLVTR